MIKTNIIKGYKVTDSNGMCHQIKFEVGKTYNHKGTPKLCEAGFHFCLVANNCFNYKQFDSKNKVFEIEASGEIIHGDDKSVTNTITIIREINWSEVLTLVNTGSNNSGRANAGNRNAGNDNAGNDNAGNRNAGNRNAGNDNAGNRNAGNDNAGYYNAGCYNAGNRNAGNRNAGCYNAGNRNAGYCNAGNDNAGCFNTSEGEYMMFNKKSKWTYNDWINSTAFRLLNSISLTLHVPSSIMTEQEKKDHPYHITTGGYIRYIPFKEGFKNSWHNWSTEYRNAFLTLPNFNKKIFEEITSIKI